MTTFQLETKESIDDALDRLDDAIEARDGVQALKIIKTLDWEDQRRAVSRLSHEAADSLIKILGAEDAAKLLSHLTEAQAVEIIESLSSEDAASILWELPPSNPQTSSANSTTTTPRKSFPESKTVRTKRNFANS